MRPKDKGTAFERKIERRFVSAGFPVSERKTAGARYDMLVGRRPPALFGPQEPINALITEPGRGRPLVSVSLEDFLYLLAVAQVEARVECKKRGGPLWHHTTYLEKFGG